MAEAMADSSSVEGVALPVVDDHMEAVPSTLETSNVAGGKTSVDISIPEPEANAAADGTPIPENGIPGDAPATENGTADHASAKENGAAAEAPQDSTTTDQGPAEQNGGKAEDMTKKPATGPVKRLIKTSTTTKAGSTVTRPTTVVTSIKKILSSGTSGSTQSKPAPAKPSSTMSSTNTKTPPTPTVKKTASGTSTTSTTTKPSTTSKPATTSTAVARRTSMAPPSTRPLSSSTSSRPPAATAAKTAPASDAPRGATSPSSGSAVLRASTGSAAARPRASVSEGVPSKKPAAPRASMPASKLPSSGVRPLRTAGSASISSLKDVKENSKGVHGPHEKEAAPSLESNLEKFKILEAQVEATKATLTSTEIERDEKKQALEALQQSKEALEQELAVVHKTLESQQEEKQLGLSQLVQIKEELKAAQESAATQVALVVTLQAQIRAVEAELLDAKEALDASKISRETAAELVGVEREALLKAEAHMKLVQAESEALSAAQLKAQETATQRIESLEAEVQKLPALFAEVSQLKEQKEETQSKLSEAEVEVLELRETVEKATDEQGKTLTRLKVLEQELAAAGEASAAAGEVSRAKEDEHNKVLVDLKELEAQLQTALESDKKARDDLKANKENQALVFADIERLHEERIQAAVEETKRLTAELELQESKYDNRLEGVKAEHASLLDQAFQKAKSEAGLEHSQELQNLRAQSQATIEQLRQVHQASLDDAKASHEEALDTQVKTLEKQISSLNLELKATQDDLAKAKAGLEAALALEGTLRSQLEQKDAESANAPIDQSEEVAQLTKELANARDDLVNLTEAFNASKESFTQISGNHQKELEEAAMGRAEEMLKLRTSHEEETNAYKQERDGLVSRISELEVELVTMKASAEAAPSAPMSPRKDANGAATGSHAVTKEELQRMHEAHNLKVYELEASHAQTVKELQDRLDKATREAEDQQKQAERLQMEVNFAEQTAEENEDELKQLRDEIEHLKTEMRGNGEA